MKKLFSVKKVVCLAALGLVICMSATACGKKSEPAEVSDTVNANVSVIEVGEKVVSEDTTLPEMVTDTSEDENAEVKFSAACDAEYDRIDSYFHSYSKDGMATEITIVKVADSSDVANVMNSLSKHLEDRKGTFAEYAPEQVTMVEDAVLVYEGNYIGLFVGEKAGLEKETFENALK